MEGGTASASESGGLESGDSGLTGTQELSESIAQTYGLSPVGAFNPRGYKSRKGIFQTLALRTPPASAELRERRHPFVLNSYLKNTLGVSVYQPTGYAMPKNLAGSGLQPTALSNQQFSEEPVDPVDSAFGTQSPHLDSGVRDVERPEEEGRLSKETDLRRRALHVEKGRKDKYDYGS